MSDPEPLGPERLLTGGTICIFLAIAGFGYGFALLNLSIGLSVIVWIVSVVFLYIGWVLAVDGLVLVVRIELVEGPYSQ